MGLQGPFFNWGTLPYSKKIHKNRLIYLVISMRTYWLVCARLIFRSLSHFFITKYAIPINSR
jgi:hypothetical protein